MLLSLSSGDRQYATVFMTISGDKVSSYDTFPLLIIPEKTIKNKPTGALSFMKTTSVAPQEDVNSTSVGLITFPTLYKALYFKDTASIDTTTYTEEELKEEIENVHGKQDWDSEEAQELLDSAKQEVGYNYYEDLQLKVVYISYPFITLRECGEGYTGGAHGFWFDKEVTNYLSSLFPRYQVPLEPEESYFIPELNCVHNDSLIALLQEKVNNGDFIDERQDTTGGYSGDTAFRNPYCVLERVKGVPHWKLRGDVSASYAQSGDYEFTAEVDLGVMDKYHTKKSKYAISSPDGQYGMSVKGNKLNVFNSANQIIGTYKLPFKMENVVQEEWASDQALTKWKSKLNK